ncbi:thiamine phosphate synthase [Sulfurovum sp.]|uniref:thiamine phosphate synthase n=1 Tax=Sulfurovum sp. TaxID=1969726 RepID=UPI00286839C2|nr:thiamine phosphate synthase [Sulfurovum sp.]
MISYAITDPTTLNLLHIESDIKRFSDKKASMIVYRDKENGICTYDAQKFVDEARKYNFEKVLLHRDIALAKKSGLDGVHLTSKQFKEIEVAKREGLFVVISTHSIEEAKKAEKLGADMVTYSPIFKSPRKREPVGLHMLSELTSSVKIPVIALGGILTDEQAEACQMSGACGFASIRYFA